MSTYDTEMSFLDHLEIFRWHLIRSIAVVFFISIIAFIFKNIVFDVILLGPKDPNFFTYRFLCQISNFVGLNDALCLKESPFSLMNINMSGQFSTHITTSFFAGIILGFPYICWELWCFIRPALYNDEAKVARGVVFTSSILFFLGVLFGYYVIAPLSINFLGSYQVSSVVSNQISLSSFISTVTAVTFMNGIIFQLPIIVYFFSKMGLLTPEIMRRYRKHSIVGTLILSAIITPPDITSQILVSFPLIILYELSIKISANIVKKQI